MNTQDDEGDSRLKDPLELLGETGTADEQGGERILKDHQMVGVDAHVVISPLLADVIGDQWNGSRKKLSLEVFPIHTTKSSGIIRRREMPSPDIIVVVWSCSMGRERGGNLYNSRWMYPTSNLI